MNEDLFWNLIEQAYDSTIGANPYAALKAKLERLPLGDLLEFSKTYGEYQDRLYTAGHLA